MNRSRIWLDNVALTANTTLPVNNVPSKGIPGVYRLDSLFLDFELDLTPAGVPTNFVLLPGQLFDMLDALVAQIRIFSTPLGDVVGRMSLGQLVRAWLPLGARIHGIEGLLGGAVLAGNPRIFFSVEIPYAAPFMNVRGLFAPQAYQFPDGGLQITTGSLVFTALDNGGVNETWTATGNMQARWVGRDMGIKLKTSPLMTEFTTASDRSRVVENGGLHVALVQLTDTVDILGSVQAPVQAGIELRADGRPIYTGEEYNPLSALNEARGNSVNSLLAALSTAAPNTALSIVNPPGISRMTQVPFIPIIFPTDYTTQPDRFPRASKLTIVYQNGFTSPYDEAHVYVRPLAKVGDVSGCECAGPAMSGNPQIGSADVAEAFAPALIG